MEKISAADQLVIFGRYIGQQVLINSLLCDDLSIGTLAGIKQNALMVAINDVNRWIPVLDNFSVCEIKLLLKPLKKLTPKIMATANGLPVQAFITPYYQQLGFDMPVYIAPNHPLNCKYVEELGLAEYRSVEEIFQQRALLQAFESA